MNILIISPVRNEDKYIRTTIECMINQTLLPICWVIVNDGSTDNTGNIIDEYTKKHAFIKHLKLSDRGYRKPGQGVIEAFYEGIKYTKGLDYDCISKFDGDLEFPQDTLEVISNYLNINPTFGIVGGTRYERWKENGAFVKILVPNGFVGGPYKFYRRKCFEDINGLIKRAGWDGVDIIKAKMKGWETGEIETLQIKHLKVTGSASGEGLKKACEKYGDVSYFMGGYYWYFLCRVIFRSIEGRNLNIGIYMLRGYHKSKNINIAREAIEFNKQVKKIQISNLYCWFKILLKYK